MATKAKGKSKAVRQTKVAHQSSGEDMYDRLEQRLANSSRSFGDFWKVPEGKSVIRVIPFQHDGQSEVFVAETGHFFAREKKGFSCSGETCPICEWAEDQVEEVRRNYFPNTKYLANVIVRGGGEGGKDVLVRTRLAKTIVEGIKARKGSTGRPGIMELAKQYKAFHPETGRDFTINRGMDAKGFVEYTVTVSQKPSRVGMVVKPVDLMNMKRPTLPAQEMETVIAGLKKKYGR